FISLKELIEVETFMELDDIGLDLFYMETLSFMEFFNNEFGEAKFQLLLDSLKTGASDKSALRYSTGLEIEELDKIWRTNLSGKSEEDTAWALQVIEENKEAKKIKKSPEKLVIYVYFISLIMLIAGFGVAYLVRWYLLE
ncbi:MAG: hypothetical protein KAS39_05925, partial [Actinomycetia bacterium]|nr:hypothetical protein [Actinomycetes bacterium]